ncbi:MAG: single-stranded-DNA-specific exonuclease RecJ [Planctomycetota bacterium]
MLAARPALREGDLEPRLTAMHDPSGIPDLDRAAGMLLADLAEGRTIAIYGDYDVDGATASAILHHALKGLDPGARLLHYVPHRTREGYGLHAHALEELASEGARTVVTVDCGITAREPARRARELGLALIITDHHNPPARLDELPPADAVVHPRRPDSEYPFEHLCGAGVAFKLAWRLATMAGGARAMPEMRRLLLDLLPLAALGTVADVMKLVGENRAIVAHGVAMLRGTRVRGLAALAERCTKPGEPIRASDLGFRLGPRINALGRVADAAAAVELLTTDDAARIEPILAEMDRLNGQRQAIEKRIVEEAARLAEDAGMHRDERRAIVLAHEDWHPGVIGIACSRLVERYGRPTILLQRDGDICRGSGRSIPGFNLHAALGECGEHLLSFGGHDAAAGLALASDRLDAFADAFTAATNRDIEVDDLMPTLSIDAEAQLPELTVDAVAQLDRLAPFGMGNPAPRVLVRGVRVAQPPTLMGAGGGHLSIVVGQDDAAVRLVGWNWGRHAERLRAASRLDAVLVPKVETFRGTTAVRGEIADARLIP